MIPLVIILFLACAEAVLWLMVARWRTEFPWIITRKDVAPALDEERVEKFLATSFHETLGWLHRPRARWNNPVEHGNAEYSIDARGRRTNPGFEEQPTSVAVYGDSYAFCRLVNDGQTWPHHLSRLLRANVANYGVGNYGLDQAYLRYEMDDPREAEVVIMAIVPETIARVQSYWKHYFEYGNVLAFKPRFVLENGQLRKVPSAVRCKRDFKIYASPGTLSAIQAVDGFYHRKFRRDLMSFPLLWKLCTRPGRHLPVLYHLAAGSLSGAKSGINQKAFAVILKENAWWTKKLYGEQSSRDLLREILVLFAQRCTQRRQKPLLVVLPQPTDLQQEDNEDQKAFFESVEDVLPVVNFTSLFHEGFYVQGPLGPHTSEQGNRMIAETLAPYVKSLRG